MTFNPGEAGVNPGLPATHPFALDIERLMTVEAVIFTLACAVTIGILAAVSVSRRKAARPPVRKCAVVRAVLTAQSLSGLIATALQVVPWYTESVEAQAAWEGDVGTWLDHDYGVIVGRHELDLATSNKPFRASVNGVDTTLSIGARPDGSLVLVDSAKVPVPTIP